LDLIKEHSKFWISIVGQRGYTGKKTVNASTMHNKHFEIIQTGDADAIINDIVNDKKKATAAVQFNTLFE
jgi:N-acetyl-gamma-glutamylphosphate reductase